jgi:hypothetical protein
MVEGTPLINASSVCISKVNRAFTAHAAWVQFLDDNPVVLHFTGERITRQVKYTKEIKVFSENSINSDSLTQRPLGNNHYHCIFRRQGT